MASYEIQGQRGAYTLETSGRDEWALRQLMATGPKGCTPIDNPAPRWSAYVHKLRRMGIDIETVNERHGGPYPGRHARYVLHSIVRALEAQRGKAA
jgi:hypothetical protein